MIDAPHDAVARYFKRDWTQPITDDQSVNNAEQILRVPRTNLKVQSLGSRDTLSQAEISQTKILTVEQ